MKSVFNWLNSRVTVTGIPAGYMLIMLIFVLLGYWPVTSSMFALKNDAVNYFLPVRHEISIAIRSGNFPFWSPYLYMGYPLAADIQSGVFNPVVWMFSIIHPYTLYSLHLETLFYLCVSAIAACKLLKDLGIDLRVASVIALAYAFCGFFTDNGQNIAWLANGAYLPLSYIYFIRLFKSINFRNTAKLALSIYLLLTAGYPSFLFYEFYLFLLIALAWMFIKLRKGQKKAVVGFLKQGAIAILLTVLFCAAPVYHFLQGLPYYDRGSGISLETALTNSLNPLGYLSLLFSSSVSKAPWNAETDFSMVNSYLGILVLPFMVVAVKKFRNRIHFCLYLLLFLSLFLSFGKSGGIRTLTYEWIPYMNTYRHPANFRIFVIQIILFLSAEGIQIFLYDKTKPGRFLLPRTLALLFILTLLIMLLFWPSFNIPDIATEIEGLRDQLKAIQLNADHKIFIFATGLFQLLSLVLGYICLKKENAKGFGWILLLNLVLVAQPALFTTFVSRQSVSKTARMLEANSGYGTISGDPGILVNDTGRILGYPASLREVFSKKVAIQNILTDPTILNSYRGFIDNLTLSEIFAGYPIAYLPDTLLSLSSQNQVQYFQNRKIALADATLLPALKSNPEGSNFVIVDEFGPNRFHFTINSGQENLLCLFQNIFPPYWEARVNGKPVSIMAVNKAFMGIPVGAGRSEIELRIRKSGTFLTLGISLLSIIISLVLLQKTGKPAVNQKNKHINE